MKMVFKLTKFMDVYHTIDKVAPLVHSGKLTQLSAFITLGVHNCHRLSVARALAPGSYKQEIPENRAQMG